MGLADIKETRIVAIFNVVDGSVDTTVINASHVSDVDAIEIDDVVQTVAGTYSLATGQHTIKITLKNMVTMATGVFVGVTLMTECSLPDTFKTIGTTAFDGCSGLTKIYIPKSVATINNYAFRNCSSLSEVHIEDIEAWCKTTILYNNAGTNPLNGGRHLYLGKTEIIDLVVPSGITSLEKTFWGAKYIESVQLPSTIATLGYMTFGGCTALTSINIPEGVTTIGIMCFDNAKIGTLVLPSTLTSIGNYAFRNNNTLTSITCFATSPPSIGSSTFYATGRGPIYVPTASVDTYKSAQNWSSLASRIQAIPT